jgi:hypothetical protein
MDSELRGSALAERSDACVKGSSDGNRAAATGQTAIDGHSPLPSPATEGSSPGCSEYHGMKGLETTGLVGLQDDSFAPTFRGAPSPRRR